MEELSILKQMPMPVPQTRDHIAWVLDDGGIDLPCRHDFLCGFDHSTEQPINNGEAPSSGQVFILGPDCFVTVDSFL
jgi:hypothetical protein